MLFTNDGFQSFELLGGGTQDWRVVSLMITKDALLWGSDNDLTPASVFRWDFAEQRLMKLQEIGSPSYYSTQLQDGTFVLSTTYEPESDNTRLNGLRPTTDLWASKDGETWLRVLSLDYQRKEMSWGHPSRAAIAFPAGAKTKDLFLTPLFTKRDEFTTLLIRLGSDLD